jgi:hypothetical protein
MTDLAKSVHNTLTSRKVEKRCWVILGHLLRKQVAVSLEFKLSAANSKIDRFLPGLKATNWTTQAGMLSSRCF